MKRFETGKEYYARSACQHDCIWTFKIISRTEKRMKIEDEHGAVKTIGITAEAPRQEIAFPLGKYSLCPVLTAEKEVTQ